MQLLTRVIFVEREKWLTQREFLEDWALSRLSPGIHNVALVGLIGRQLDGIRGVIVAVAAVMLPSGAITAVMTAGYVLIRDEPLARSALAGMGPVTVGMTAGVATMIARSATRRGRRAIFDWSVFGVALVAGFASGLSPIVIFLIGTLIGAVALGREKTPPELPAG